MTPGQSDRGDESAVVIELRDALEDAIRRAYAEGIDEAITNDPRHLRRLTRIQAAAWETVRASRMTTDRANGLDQGEVRMPDQQPQPQPRSGQSESAELAELRLTRGELEAVIIGTEASRLKPVLRPERWEDAASAERKLFAAHDAFRP